MSIYALSDFHLSFGVGDKPMNVLVIDGMITKKDKRKLE